MRKTFDFYSRVLGRERVEVPDFEQIAGAAYAGKRVLVTGGGGSIGSELVRQLVRLKPSRVAFLDKDENTVYELEQEICSMKLGGRSSLSLPMYATPTGSGPFSANFGRKSCFMRRRTNTSL